MQWLSDLLGKRILGNRPSSVSSVPSLLVRTVVCRPVPLARDAEIGLGGMVSITGGEPGASGLEAEIPF